MCGVQTDLRIGWWSRYLNHGGNAGVPGCDSVRSCCWLLDVYTTNKGTDGKPMAGVASGFKFLQPGEPFIYCTKQFPAFSMVFILTNQAQNFCTFQC